MSPESSSAKHRVTRGHETPNSAGAPSTCAGVQPAPLVGDVETAMSPLSSPAAQKLVPAQLRAVGSKLKLLPTVVHAPDPPLGFAE